MLSSYCIISVSRLCWICALLADLADDGLLDFEWELIGQRFSSFTGTLTVNYSDKPAVPEGGMTAGLLGFALLGIGALRRKL